MYSLAAVNANVIYIKILSIIFPLRRLHSSFHDPNIAERTFQRSAYSYPHREKKIETYD